MKQMILMTLAAMAIALIFSDYAWAVGYGSVKGRRAHNKAQTYAWHGDYYDATWGMPVPLVVPPKAESQVKYSWGVGSTRVVPIEHQFGRAYPGPGGYGSGAFRPTPAWPSDTDQFGVYYVRGPWK
jgi:hypothetical protein